MSAQHALHQRLLRNESQRRHCLSAHQRILDAAHDRLAQVEKTLAGIKPHETVLDEATGDRYQALILERGRLHQTVHLAGQTLQAAETPLSKATFKDQPGYDLHEGPQGKNRWMRDEDTELSQRDELTSRYFNGRNIAISGYFQDLTFSGGILDRELLPWLMGAPDDSRIYVKRRRGGFEFEIRHAILERPLRYVLDANRVLHGMEFYLKPNTPSGIGTRMFATTAMTASQLGMPEIQIVAAGRPDNGYYTWPRLGFDAPLSDAEKTALSKITHQPVQTIKNLIDSEILRQWWREHGTQREMNFKLAFDSDSMRALINYLAETGVIL